MAYQVKISIKDIKPAIWRRLRIPGNITFQQLHQVIQAAFGWLDYHLYKFQFEKTIIMVPDDDYHADEMYGEGIKELDSRIVRINEFFDVNDKCEYEYDFGDSWKHEIVIEKRLKDTRKNSVPVCLGGARERPPEDVGGAGGYEDFLDIIRDKKNPEREGMLNWAEKDTGGRIYDPEYFNINETNRRLAYSLENDPEHAKELLTGKGLTGTVVWGWSGVCIKTTRGKTYTLEQIGNFLLILGEGSKVDIKVTPRREE